MMSLRSCFRIPVLLVLLVLGSSCTRQENLRPDCMIDTGPCVRTVEGLTVILDITPRPVRAMRDVVFEVRLRRDGEPANGAAREVDLTMPGMKMGENRVLLRRRGGDLYQGRGVFVRCPSGQTLWRASVLVDLGDHEARAEYLLDVP